MFLDVIVIVLILLLGYTWVGYPVLLIAISKRKTESEKQTAEKEETPYPESSIQHRASIIFAAHNEEGVIGERLANLIDVIGDRDVQVHVGLDGCEDSTAEVARNLLRQDYEGQEAAKDHKNIHIHEFTQRRGKVAVLKELVKKVQKVQVVQEEEGEGDAFRTEGREASEENLSGLRSQVSSLSSVLVFTDANTHFRKDALDKLLAPFNDSAIGGVCGRLVFLERNLTTDDTDEHGCFSTTNLLRSQSYEAQEYSKHTKVAEIRDEKSSSDFSNVCHQEESLHLLRSQVSGLSPNRNLAPEGFYWRWETTLKMAESQLDSCLGANGAIYAIREELFWKEIPDNTVVDDFVIGMKVREQGFRMIYEPLAIAEEELPELSNEWGRRIRIGSGDYQALSFCRKCLSLEYKKFAWSFLSHKVLRWLTPQMMLVVIPGFWLQVIFGWLFYEANGFFRSTFSVALGMIGSGCTLLFILSAMLGGMMREKSKGDVSRRVAESAEDKDKTTRSPDLESQSPWSREDLVNLNSCDAADSNSPNDLFSGESEEKSVSASSATPREINPQQPNNPCFAQGYAGQAKQLNNGHAVRRAALAYFRLCDHFMTMQAALFVGFVRYCRGDLKGFWTRTPR
ncbi:hypothetical protein BVX94_01410 [bacterium B17]|nr:hypothetical protein BVX94_01410 [bacterium B17]